MNTNLISEAEERIRRIDLTLCGLFKQLNKIKERVGTDFEMESQHKQIRRVENYIAFLELQKSRTFIVIETSLTTKSIF